MAQVLSELLEIVQCSTDREAINLGIWMHETLSLLARWRVSNVRMDAYDRNLPHATVITPRERGLWYSQGMSTSVLILLPLQQANEEVFSSECLSSVCFSANGKPSTKRTTYEEFRRLNAKWQMKLARRFIDCLGSDEYVQTRNALLILNKIVKVCMVA